MNVERIREIADNIEKFPKNYNQGSWGFELSEMLPSIKMHKDCGTAACVAGWACALHVDNDYDDPHAEAERILSLTEEESAILFNANWPIGWVELIGLVLTPHQIKSLEGGDYCASVFFPNPEQAVKVLRYFAGLGFIHS